MSLICLNESEIHHGQAQVLLVPDGRRHVFAQLIEEVAPVVRTGQRVADRVVDQRAMRGLVELILKHEAQDVARADLHQVAFLELMLLNSNAVDPRAVTRAQIEHPRRVGGSHDPRVLALKASLLVAWAFITFVLCFFARELSFRVGHWPFSYSIC